MEPTNLSALKALESACEWTRKFSKLDLNQTGRNRIFYVAAHSQHVCEALLGDQSHIESLDRTLESLRELANQEAFHDPKYRGSERKPIPKYLVPVLVGASLLLVGILIGKLI